MTLLPLNTQFSWLAHISLAFLLAIATLPFAGCGESGPKQVVVYTALDEEFSKPIFDAFTRRTGIEVLSKFDTESTKTVGLANAILAEKERPRCDLFWNNEILHTLRLKKSGVLRNQPMSTSQDYDKKYRSADHDWYGFAARARVLIVNTNRVKEARRPKSIRDLTDPQWYEQCAIAKPLFGTMATHAACLFEALGEEEAKQLFEGIKRNAQVLSGNKQVAQDVASGKLMFGLTDTDDAMIELEAGRPVTIIYPDQIEDGLGTLFIPNTIAMIKDSPNQTTAHALAEFLLSPMVEGRLVDGPSAQIPLNRRGSATARVKTPDEITPMEVDFNAAAENWDSVAKYLAETFSL